MNSEEKAKLHTLLGYWIEHNQEHCEEFRDWAKKAQELGEQQAAGELKQAIAEMEKAGTLLQQARSRLED